MGDLSSFPSRIDADRAAEYRRRGWWAGETLADHVARYAANRGSESAYVTADSRLTWRDYDACSDRLGSAMLALGIRRDERVAIQLPDSATVHVALLACEKAGVVAVGIGARAGERERRHIIAKTSAVALISHDEHGGQPMRTVAAALPGIRHHVVVPRFDHDPAAPLLLDGTIAHPAAIDPAALAQVRFGPDEFWMVNSTSGTTGMPKCVMHTQNRWWYFHQIASDVGALNRDDVIMSVIPAPFGFGQWTTHFTPTYLGVPTVVAERFSAVQTLELLERERVTVLCAVSTQFRMLLAEPSIEQRDLSALRLMFTGGESVPYESARRFEEITGAVILNFYGSNESGFATTTTIRDPREKRLSTSGRAQPGTELRLYEDGEDVTSSRRGQPGARGPAVCLGYLDDPEANAELFTPDGFLMHADIVELDDEGYLSVVGRKSDLIIRGGKNISARLVEDEVAAHPRVALAAAVPIPDSVFGERVCVYVELREPGPFTLEELAEFMLARGVSKEILPERLIVLAELPQSSGGKIAKAALRQAAAQLAHR
ncbi:MAG TPA: class I adenylate-forming enzyme family protein [Streptosporangiaceae bacterium]|nr:class I adenylate-forming enzyme family protein [Streptosporangiaceae bacterium]